MELRGKAVPGENEPLDKWLQAMRKAGLPRNGAMVFSAHQMGTCRMGADPKKSVVGPTGEVWSCHNLFVCDASVFPTSSGVNPMLTTMAIADGIAEHVFMRAKAEAGGFGEPKL